MSETKIFLRFAGSVCFFPLFHNKFYLRIGVPCSLFQSSKKYINKIDAINAKYINTFMFTIALFFVFLEIRKNAMIAIK
ncbi:hypothetical protein LNTAR_19197 [Lentisphaera araneosa HTCC2155]|uniref:Uncharacterized protein n=1 Tax=Lentisphaera araneosa HTCC2155 TaxID=313628 RepID=A6DQQ5_9BACT|nr:hypothetical protein LNTAR_19197 [Lentisphaera araneosa HTCC2155]